MEHKAHKIAKLVWKKAGLDPEETIHGQTMGQFEAEVRAILED